MPVFSHPEISGCLDLPVMPIVSESDRHRSGTVNAAEIHSDLLELYAEETNSEETRWLDSDDLEFRKWLFNQPYQSYSDIDTLSICSNCMKQGEKNPRFTGCRFARYCFLYKNCHVKDWPSHKQMYKAIQTLPSLGDYSGGLYLNKKQCVSKTLISVMNYMNFFKTLLCTVLCILKNFNSITGCDEKSTLELKTTKKHVDYGLKKVLLPTPREFCRRSLS